MKKIKFLTIALLAMTVQSVFAQNNRIIRRHNGEVTFYTSSDIQKAINDCAAGDTITLGKGNFSGFEIRNQPITIIGNGVENTSIVGDVTIGKNNYNSYPPLVFNNRALDGLKITGNINLRNVDNVKVRKCEVENITHDSYYFDPNSRKLELENCYIHNIVYGIKNISVTNSIIGYIDAAMGNGYFLNSYVKRARDNYDGYMENCIIGNQDNYTYNKGSWTNCLFLCNEERVNELVRTDCYFNEGVNVDDLTDDALKSLTYIGSDGTIVGPYGGPMPFNLEKLNPITSVNLKVDDANQKLNVTVKLADKQ